MATPANKLDKYVTYTYYFELHASTAFEDLKAVQDVMSDVETTRRQSVGTMLINGRRDAHQSIDNVKFTYLSNFMDATAAMIATTDVTLDVIEAGGISFIEKLLLHAEKYHCNNLTSELLFGLKIIFVGQFGDGSTETVVVPHIIPLNLVAVSSKFTQMGGVYSMHFAGAASSAAPSSGQHSTVSLVSSGVNKNITVRGKTVQDAFADLERQLNLNYEDTYNTEMANNIQARPLRYIVRPDKELSGKLTLNTTETKAPDDECKITFGANTPVTAMIQEIIGSSKELNEKIGASRENLKKELHPDVFIPTITPSYNLTANALELTYNVDVYRGGGQEYTFDFYFTEAGKNVDIIDFDVAFPHMEVYLASRSNNSTALNSNMDAKTYQVERAYFVQQTLHQDVSRKTSNPPVERQEIRGRGNGNIAPLPLTPWFEHTNYVMQNTDAVSSRRLAFSTMAEAAGANNFQITFTVRGYYQLLESVVEHPDGELKSFGSTEGAWIRVNIYDQYGEPFFYTGLYQLLSVENVFSGGKFTQNLHVLMKGEG